MTKGFPAVLVFLNDTRGGFAKPESYYVAPSPYDISCRDVNGDGALDLVMTNLESDRGTILLNAKNGTFRKPEEFPLLLAKALTDDPVDVNTREDRSDDQHGSDDIRSSDSRREVQQRQNPWGRRPDKVSAIQQAPT